MKPLPHTTRLEGRGFRIAFWVCAGFGFLVMSTGWVWLGNCIYKEIYDRGNAGPTMDVFMITLGVVPLVLAHGVGLMLLLILGWHGWRGSGLIYGTAAVVTASILGLILAQILFGGALFDPSSTYVP